jgi:acyl-coenzyme A synthetase/AMP-(fatty) acid ligase
MPGRLDALPKNHNGKVLKTHLRELYAQTGEAAG